MSWTNTSSRSRLNGSNIRTEGRVYIRLPRIDDHWYRLSMIREDRVGGTLAAVAANASRFQKMLPFIEATHSTDGRFYGEAGNPILPALLVGQLGAVLESECTTLHDSAFLIPFTLLGGTVETWDGHPLDYLGLYEKHAIDLDPKSTPIPPYLAYYGARPAAILPESA